MFVNGSISLLGVGNPQLNRGTVFDLNQQWSEANVIAYAS